MTINNPSPGNAPGLPDEIDELPKCRWITSAEDALAGLRCMADLLICIGGSDPNPETIREAGRAVEWLTHELHRRVRAGEPV